METKRILSGIIFALLMCGVFAGSTSAASAEKCKVKLSVYGYRCNTEDTEHYGVVSYSRTSANVYVNGQRVRKNFASGTISVTPGEVTVEVRKSDHETEKKTFNCPAGSTIEKEFQLNLAGCVLKTEVYGLPVLYLSIFETPISNVRLYVDGKLNRDFKCKLVSLGTHTIEAYKWGYQSDKTEVTCSEKNDRLRAELILVRNKQNCIPTVRVYNDTFMSNGERPLMWAEVYADGYNIGRVKKKAIKFEAGKTYTLIAKKDGYVSDPYVLECNAKEKPLVNLILKKI